MRFLCEDHRQVMCKQSPQVLDDTMNNWIKLAIEHYSNNRWDYALPYIGCALETCWIKAKKQPDTPLFLIEQSICLAIYCHNLLSHMGAKIQGESILMANWQWILNQVGYENKPDFVKYCLSICQNSERHQEIINKHTNWPFVHVTEMKNKVLH